MPTSKRATMRIISTTIERIFFLAFLAKKSCIHAFSSSNTPSSPAFSKQRPTTTTTPPSPPQPLFSAHVSSRASPKANSVTLTYLEINCWLLTMGGVTILVDPILDGSLNFGIPMLYEAKKKVLPQTGIVENDLLPSPIDCLLITQGLDDHAHVQTLQKLKHWDPQLPVIASPSAKAALLKSGFDQDESSSSLTFLNHGQDAMIQRRRRDNDDEYSSSATVRVQATTGALVGPPWQMRENGYILRGVENSAIAATTTSTSIPSIYIEPHVEFNPRELSKLGPVDIVISPTSGQGLFAMGPAMLFELVHGPKDTMRLLETLQPQYLVPMPNGNVNAQGPVAQLVSEIGSHNDFQRQLSQSNLQTKLVQQLIPGKDFDITL